MIANHDLVGPWLGDWSIDNLQSSLRFLKYCGKVAFTLTNDCHDYDDLDNYESCV